MVYENEEFNLLQAALNIEEDMDNLRYNKVIIATDADVDGMHIRLLLTTFFLQFFPDVIRLGHLYILQTPLFRVRNKKQTFTAIRRRSGSRPFRSAAPRPRSRASKVWARSPTRSSRSSSAITCVWTGVRLTKDDPVHDLLEFYMGKNTIDRQGFIVNNLRIEEDMIEDMI